MKNRRCFQFSARNSPVLHAEDQRLRLDLVTTSSPRAIFEMTSNVTS
jgi:hypothetical protein